MRRQKSEIRNQSPKTKILALLFCIAVNCQLTTVNCQDIHFSQFNFSPLNQNPANTNLFEGDYRFVANYRNQWQSVPVAYNTVSASVEMNFATLKNNDKIGGGLVMFYDRAGDSKFTSFNMALSGSYLLNFGKEDAHNISLGYQIGFVNRSFSYANLYFDNQFNGDAFDPNSQSNESYGRTTFTFLDMATGLAYKFKKNDRNNFTIGFSVAHFNMPKQTFFNDNSVRLNPRYIVHLRGQIKIAKKCDIVPEFMFQRQDTKQEFLAGLHFKSYIYNKGNSRIALNTGAYYRFADAPYLFAGLDYNDLQVNLSYDINTSKFTQATRANGGFEVSVIYILSKVKKINAKGAVCPIF